MQNEVETKEDIIRRFAYNFYQIRQRCLVPGDDKKDWFDACQAYESYKILSDKLSNKTKEAV